MYNLLPVLAVLALAAIAEINTAAGSKLADNAWMNRGGAGNGLGLRSPASRTQPSNWDNSASEAASMYQLKRKQGLRSVDPDAKKPKTDAELKAEDTLIYDITHRLGWNVKKICTERKCVTHGNEWGCTKRSDMLFKLRPFSFQLLKAKEGAVPTKMNVFGGRYDTNGVAIQDGEIDVYGSDQLDRVAGANRKKNRKARKLIKSERRAAGDLEEKDPALVAEMAQRCPVKPGKNGKPGKSGKWCKRMVKLTKDTATVASVRYLYASHETGLVVSCTSGVSVVIIPANVKDIPQSVLAKEYPLTGDLENYGQAPGAKRAGAPVVRAGAPEDRPEDRPKR